MTSPIPVAAIQPVSDDEISDLVAAIVSTRHDRPSVNLDVLRRLIAELRRLRAAVPYLTGTTDDQLDDTFPKSWAGFRAFLDEIYPDDIFPDDDRDLGPSFVVAVRRLATVESEAVELRRRLTEVEAANESLRHDRSLLLTVIHGGEAELVEQLIEDADAALAKMRLAAADTPADKDEPQRCEACHRPLPHTEPERRVCPSSLVDVPAPPATAAECGDDRPHQQHPVTIDGTQGMCGGLDDRSECPGPGVPAQEATK